MLKLSRSAYYAWLNTQPSQRILANIVLDQVISRFYVECHGFVGYRMMRALLLESKHKASLVRSAFDMAMQHRGHPQGVIFHSDRGSQYAAHEFRLQLALTRTAQSMSAKGCCYDNAVAESFFKTLKTTCAYRMFGSLELAKTTVFQFIEMFYNQRRPHSFNNYLSPNQKERLYFQKLNSKAA